MQVAIRLNGDSREELPIYRAAHRREADTLYITGFEQVENIADTGTGDVRIGYDDGGIDTVENAEIVRVSP